VLYLPYFKNVTNFVGHEQEVVSGGKESSGFVLEFENTQKQPV
jgi:hypothetical protein